MKDYRKNMRLALVCFLLVVVLNFFLPRLLPGDPVAYLTGFSEQDMTPAQVAFYEEALHLNKPLAAQFGFYLRSLLDGTLGYSYKKDAAVSRSSVRKSAIHCRSRFRRCCFRRGLAFSGDFGAGTKRIRLPTAFLQQH